MLCEVGMMSTPTQCREAIGILKGVLKPGGEESHDQILRDLIDAKDEVLARYQEVFTPAGINQVEAEDVREFLMFRNNRHWSGLQRMGPGITSDMKALRASLLELINEDMPVAHRLNNLLPGGTAKVRKLGKAVLTPILMITQPEKYGVWNGTSEGAMKKLQIWPEFERNLSIGERYEVINDVMLQLANDLGTDLWTLDALWWRVQEEKDQPVGETSPEEELASGHFGLERHLHDFLFDNWEQTQLNQEWDLVEEGGDVKGYGYERTTEIGRIDLLAKHKTQPRWLVIELKRGQTSDDTVGQILRYLGWVKKHLAEPGEQVEGLIIGLKDDLKLHYALETLSHVRFLKYQVEFSLVES